MVTDTDKFIQTLSPRIKKGVGDFIDMIFYQVELVGLNPFGHSYRITIPNTAFEKEGLDKKEIDSIVNLINKLAGKTVLIYSIQMTIEEARTIRLSYKYVSDDLARNPIIPTSNPDHHLFRLNNRGSLSDLKNIQTILAENTNPSVFNKSEISFDDKNATIKIKDIYFQLPPEGLEYALAKVVFNESYESSDPVDWIDIASEITGKNMHELRENKSREMRSIYDTVKRINNRLNIELFIWKAGVIIRNY